MRVVYGNPQDRPDILEQSPSKTGFVSSVLVARREFYFGDIGFQHIVK